MDKHEIRLECLKMAKLGTFKAEENIRVAALFEAYVLGSEEDKTEDNKKEDKTEKKKNKKSDNAISIL